MFCERDTNTKLTMRVSSANVRILVTDMNDSRLVFDTENNDDEIYVEETIPWVLR